MSVAQTSPWRSVRSFDASGGTYGSPRVHVELRERGWRVSKNTVATLMAELGLAASQSAGGR
ncbi:transposase [Streptomyces noursei]|uniref:transposase n=1 Tax=Streptomyces noursei TaxID=1971 RepID=UPI00289C76E1